MSDQSCSKCGGSGKEQDEADFTPPPLKSTVHAARISRVVVRPVPDFSDDDGQPPSEPAEPRSTKEQNPHPVEQAELRNGAPMGSSGTDGCASEPAEPLLKLTGTLKMPKATLDTIAPDDVLAQRAQVPAEPQSFADWGKQYLGEFPAEPRCNCHRGIDVPRSCPVHGPGGPLDLAKAEPRTDQPCKFRKRPIEVTAQQIPPRIEPDRLRYYEHLGVKRVPWWLRIWYRCEFGIETLEGWHVVRPGDWIITGIKGEKYPCKPDIFEATYERA